MFLSYKITSILSSSVVAYITLKLLFYCTLLQVGRGFWSCLLAGQSPHLIQHPSSTGNIIIMLITQSHPLDMLKCKTGGESGFNTTQRTLTRTLSTRRRRRQNMENWGALNSIKIIHRKARLVQT